MNQDRDELDIENSFVFFLITIQKLNLSSHIMAMMYQSNTTIIGFVFRNKASLRKRAGVLVL